MSLHDAVELSKTLSLKDIDARLELLEQEMFSLRALRVAVKTMQPDTSNDQVVPRDIVKVDALKQRPKHTQMSDRIDLLAEKLQRCGALHIDDVARLFSVTAVTVYSWLKDADFGNSFVNTKGMFTLAANKQEAT